MHQSWDHAAGIVCVAEAGGCVTDLHGDPLAIAGATSFVPGMCPDGRPRLPCAVPPAARRGGVDSWGESPDLPWRRCEVFAPAHAHAESDDDCGPVRGCMRGWLPQALSFTHAGGGGVAVTNSQVHGDLLAAAVGAGIWWRGPPAPVSRQYHSWWHRHTLCARKASAASPPNIARCCCSPGGDSEPGASSCRSLCASIVTG